MVTRAFTRNVGRAFTLIELLVVVAIIALLIAILLPSLANAKRLSVQTKCGTNLSALGRAIQAYQSEYNYAPLSARAGYKTSGWAANQTLTIRSDLGGSWSINGYLAPFIGGGASRLLVCPATPTSPLPLMALPSGNTAWWNYNNTPEKIASGVGTIWGWGTYMWFVGDQGNGTNSGANPGGTNPNLKDIAYTNLDGTPYNRINVAPNLLNVDQNVLLVQDFLQKDFTTGNYHGNHTLIGGNYLPQISATDSKGRHNVYSGYYLDSKVTGFAGVNVLLSNWAVEWRKTSDLRPVNAGGTSAPPTLQLAMPPGD